MRNHFELVVFDWDGTLMDSIAAIVACTEAAIESAGVEPPADPRAIRDSIGLGLRETIDFLCPDADPELERRVLEAYRELWLSDYKDRSIPFPGAREALERLAGDGYLLAVATSKSRRGLDRELGATRLGDLFHASRTADEARSKPHPQMLLDILDELGLLPASALMVGDTTYDLSMARSAGSPAVAVASGAHPRALLLEQQPLALLEDVGAVPPWLAGSSGG